MTLSKYNSAVKRKVLTFTPSILCLPFNSKDAYQLLTTSDVVQPFALLLMPLSYTL
jgi:hypothetical protein